MENHNGIPQLEDEDGVPSILPMATNDDARNFHDRFALRPPKRHGARLYTRSNLLGITIVGEQARISTREAVRDALKKIPGYQWSLVSKEASMDGNHHFHCAVYVDGAQRRISPEMIFDWTGFRVCLSGANNGWLIYLIKEDKNPLYDGISEETVNAMRHQWRNAGITERIYEQLKTHTLQEVAEMPEFAKYVLQHYNQLKQYVSQMQDYRRQRAMIMSRSQWELIDLAQFDRYDRPGRINYDKTLAAWLNYIMTTPNEELAKNCHFWLSGSTNIGKTKLGKMLSKKLNVFWWNKHRTGWQDDYPEHCAPDLIIVDEMNEGLDCNLSMQDINELCDGMKKINQRNKAAIVRDRIVPVLVLSNMEPELFWIGADNLVKEAVLARFTKLHVINNQYTEKRPKAMDDPDHIHVFHEMWTIHRPPPGLVEVPQRGTIEAHLQGFHRIPVQHVPTPPTEPYSSPEHEVEVAEGLMFMSQLPGQSQMFQDMDAMIIDLDEDPRTHKD
jgi:hypothetical protein